MTTNNACNFSNPVNVAAGGTGVSSIAANGIICGGITSGANLQVVSPGTAHQYYQSQGAGSLGNFANAPAGDRIFLQSQTASTTAAINFFGLNSNFIAYAFEFLNVATGTNNKFLKMQVSYDGSTFIGTSSYINLSYFSGSSANTGSFTSGTTNTGFLFSAALSISLPGAYGRAHLFNPSGSNNQSYIAQMGGWQTAPKVQNQPEGFRLNISAAPVLGVSFAFASANILSGTINMYGLKA